MRVTLCSSWHGIPLAQVHKRNYIKVHKYTKIPKQNYCKSNTPSYVGFSRIRPISHSFTSIFRRDAILPSRISERGRESKSSIYPCDDCAYRMNNFKCSRRIQSITSEGCANNFFFFFIFYPQGFPFLCFRLSLLIRDAYLHSISIYVLVVGALNYRNTHRGLRWLSHGAYFVQKLFKISSLILHFYANKLISYIVYIYVVDTSQICF